MSSRGGAAPVAVVALVALVARVACALWAAPHFPPAADGVYYDIIARRIAEGHGYTWLWPDGAVTYAAHYPIGYPALVGGLYALFGAHAVVGMLANAVLGALGALAAYAILARMGSPRRALLGGLAVALHPALVLYTPALMTEAAASTLLIGAVALATEARSGRHAWTFRAVAGVLLGAATLVRPQCVVLAPIVGWLAAGPGSSFRRRAVSSVAIGAIAVVCCLPWTARNCMRMNRCALVSVNGGWNLLIGVQTTTGAWEAVDVPSECREVWAEADKDDCFGRVARARIAHDITAFVAAAPRKVAVTFDYFGAAPWYLHTSNAAAFSEHAKLVAGAVETVASRLLLLGALVAAARCAGPRRPARVAVAAVGAMFACMVHGWGGYLALAVAILMLGPKALYRGPPAVAFSAALVLATMATHAAFFGAGRYGLVVAPFVALLAFVPPRPALASSA